MVRKNTNRRSSNTPQSRAVWDRQRYIMKWRDLVYTLAGGRFKWNGLPDTIDERYLETILLTGSNSVFFELDGELRATKVVFDSAPDIYGNYDSYRAIGANGTSYEIADGEGVVCWDNKNRRSIVPTLELYAEELAELDELQRVNRRQQRNMVAFAGPAEMQADLAKMARNMEMSEDQVIVSEKMLDAVTVQAINTGVEYRQKDFHEDFTALINRLYMTLGIDHIQFEKQAHMLETEAQKGTDSVMRIRDNYLSSRKEAADIVNNKFNTNISVEWRGLDLAETPGEHKEGEGNGRYTEV